MILYSCLVVLRWWIGGGRSKLRLRITPASTQRPTTSIISILQHHQYHHRCSSRFKGCGATMTHDRPLWHSSIDTTTQSQPRRTTERQSPKSQRPLLVRPSPRLCAADLSPPWIIILRHPASFFPWLLLRWVPCAVPLLECDAGSNNGSNGSNIGRYLVSVTVYYYDSDTCYSGV